MQIVSRVAVVRCTQCSAGVKRGMRATRAGETLIDAARRAIQVVQEAEEQLRGSAREPGKR